MSEKDKTNDSDDPLHIEFEVTQRETPKSLIQCDITQSLGSSARIIEHSNPEELPEQVSLITPTTIRNDKLTVVSENMKLDVLIEKDEDNLNKLPKQNAKKGRRIAKKKSSRIDQIYKKERCIAVLTLIVNVILLILKGVAVGFSGSLSIISSLVDSAVDITTGLVIWVTSLLVRQKDPYWYPRGRTRLEPLGLIMVSIIRAVASTQVIIQATEDLIIGRVNSNIEMVTIYIMITTVAVKFMLAIVCYCNKDLPSILFMGQDNRNDCLANSIAIICAYIGDEHWKYMDPIGAILVSLFMAITWSIFGYTHAAMLGGRRADSEYINGIIKLCSEHDARIISLDTVFVYHWSTKFFVEVHLVFPETMTVETAHSIAKPLQRKIQKLPYVERAFIHMDYKRRKIESPITPTSKYRSV